MTEHTERSPTNLGITNYFQFNGKNYPINMCIFKLYSRHFQKISGIEKQVYIPFLNEHEKDLPFTEEIVQTFINYCHNHDFDDNYLTIENVVSLNYLGVKYDVLSLINKTSEFISKHPDELIIHFISFKPDSPENAKYEDLIAKDLIKYVKDPFLKQLPIPSLYRIMTRYPVNYDNEEIFDFLFDYLEAHGRDASVLFQNIEFTNQKTKYLTRLRSYPEDQFDFHFINRNAFIQIYDVQNKILKNEQDIIDKQDEAKKIAENEISFITTLKNELENDMKEVHQMKEDFIQQMKDELNKVKEDIQNNINDGYQLKNKLIAQVQNEISQLKSDMQNQMEQMNRLKDENLKQMKDTKDKYNKEIEEEIQSIKTLTSGLVLSLITDAKTELGQTKIEIENETTQKINELKEETNRIVNEQALISKGIQSKQKDAETDNKILQNKLNDLKRIIYDIDATNFFMKNDNFETFNKLKGESQWFVINGIISTNKDKNNNFDSINCLLTYFLNEQQKSNQPENSNFIIIKNDNMKESLSNYKNQPILITYEMTDILFQNGSLNSEEFINLLKRFNDIFVEVQYKQKSDTQNNNFQKIYDSLLNIKNSQYQKLKIGIYMNIHTTDQYFKGNKIISSLRFGPSVEIIEGGYGIGSFEDCSLLEDIQFSNSIKEIKGGAFNLCINLRNLIIPNSVTLIDKSAFCSCSLLTNISIPSSVQLLDSDAFKNCPNLTTLTINPNTTRMNPNCFENCHSLKRLIFSLTVETVKLFEFNIFPQLTEIIIPESVTHIESSAFNRCTSLEKISIPPTVRAIVGGTFTNCSKLKQITIDPYMTKFEKKTFSTLQHLILYPTISHIGEFDFKLFGRLKEITIPDSVISIGAKTFQGLSSLEKVTIKNSVISIEYDAFKDCNSLKDIIIGNSVKYIAGGVFCSCKSLRKISIPNSVTFIGGGAFSNCTNLEEVTLPNSIGTIENDLFYHCSKLANFIIPNSITSIGPGSFCGCTSLKNIKIPDSVFFIGEGAFYMCNKLETVLLSKSTPDILKSTFKGCSNLKEIKLPNSVASIGDDAFKECSKMESILIPDSVSSIGEGALYGCSSLKDLIIPTSVSSIGRSAFGGCSGLIRLSIPNALYSNISRYGVSGSPRITRV